MSVFKTKGPFSEDWYVTLLTKVSRHMRTGPVGRRIQVRGKWLQIVGVARTAKYRNLLETPRPFLYVLLRQSFSPVVALYIRTSQGPAELTPMLVREIHALDSNVAPSEVITMREQVERTIAPQRIGVTILVVFAALALGLAAVGLYGVMAATVSQSTRELALRIALGADAADLLRLVMSGHRAGVAGGLPGTCVARDAHGSFARVAWIAAFDEGRFGDFQGSAEIA